jgi:hypothetical protein
VAGFAPELVAGFVGIRNHTALAEKIEIIIAEYSDSEGLNGFLLADVRRLGGAA